jgi:RNA polymerase sigma factor (sigma-70 family)
MNLVTPFRAKVFRLAKRLLVSTEEAEDATQEVMLKLWNRSEQLQQYTSVEALAMTMTKNYCLDQLKSKRASNLKIVHNNFTDREAPLQKKVEDRDTWTWFERIMDDLPEQQKMIVQLRDIEEYDYEEIAAMMEMNETAVRVALSRARKAIREQLKKTHSYGISSN